MFSHLQTATEKQPILDIVVSPFAILINNVVFFLALPFCDILQLEVTIYLLYRIQQAGTLGH